MKKVFSLLLSVVLLFGVIFPSITSASSIPKKESIIENNRFIVDKPENYEIQIYSDVPNKEGVFDIIGSKKVSANTYIEKEENISNYILHVKEDYFDLKGYYLYSLVFYDEVENNYQTGVAKGKSIQKKN